MCLAALPRDYGEDTVPPYNDEELDSALRKHGLRIKDVQNNLLPLIKRPRYFDLMIRFRNQLAESGDVTIARLIYEDWRDRYQRKTQTPISSDRFQSVIKNLANVQSNKQGGLQENEIAELLRFVPDMHQVYEELRTGNIFMEKAGKFFVEEQQLIYGLGLLLADEIYQASEEGGDLQEVVTSWLEPHAEMDIKGRICEFAAIHALSTNDFPRNAKVALLRVWMNSRNIFNNTAATSVSYVPLDPETYVELAEILWSEENDNPWAQELLIRSFIQWFPSPHVQATLIRACERWLGFVPIYGWPYLGSKVGDEDSLKAQRDIQERLGYELTPGPFEYAGYSFTAVDNYDLTNLGRAALAVISHIPRAPFIRSIAIGSVADALGGRPVKYDLFEWVLLTSSDNVWPSVEIEAKHLLGVGNVITQQAAYRLLSYEGSSSAYSLRSTIPDGIFGPPSELMLHYRRDPCISGFSWNEEVCAQCVQRADLNIQTVIRFGSPHFANPALFLPDYHIRRLNELNIVVDLDLMWSLLGMTEPEALFESVEPILARYNPEKLAQTVRSVTQQIATRTGMALRQLSIHIREHSLVFTSTEFEAIRTAWNNLHKRETKWEDVDEEAETFLHRLIYLQGSAEEQLEVLINRPERLLDETRLARHFQPIVDWSWLINKLQNAASLTVAKRIVWFVSEHPQNVPSQILKETILPLVSHEDSIVRALALKTIYKSSNSEIARLVIDHGWRWDAANDGLENFWGSIIIADYGLELPIEDIAERADIAHLGYAIIQRGERAVEMAVLAEVVHQRWVRLSIHAPSLPDDLPAFAILTNTDDKPTDVNIKMLSDDDDYSVTFFARQDTWSVTPEENLLLFNNDAIQAHNDRQHSLLQIVMDAIKKQENANNPWFGSAVHVGDLELLVEHHPLLVQKWVQTVQEHANAAPYLVKKIIAFYEALCIALFRHETADGIRLYHILRNNGSGYRVIDINTGFERIELALFECEPSNEGVYEAWKSYIEECESDKELMIAATLAQNGNAGEWLWSYVSENLLSTTPIQRARALTLLGFIDRPEAQEKVTMLQAELPDTWQKELLTRASMLMRRNIWARHWYELFLTEDNLNAWAAFRLLLRCIDSRFLLWRRTVENAVGSDNTKSERLIFLADNKDTIKNSTKDNEKDLAERFLGQKKQNRRVWPWL